MTQSTVFSNYVSKNFKSELTKAVNAINKGSAMIQSLLFVITNQIEADNNASRLSDLIHALSDKTPSGKVLVSSHGKQVFKYMSEVIPCLSWDKESQQVKVSVKNKESIDFAKVHDQMKAVQWDKHGQQKADTAFDQIKTFNAIIASLEKLVDPANDVDSRLMSEASKLLSNAKNGLAVVEQIKAERKAKAA